MPGVHVQVAHTLTNSMLGNFACFIGIFCDLLIFLSKFTFSKTIFRNSIRTSNSLDPDQA